MIFLSHPHLAEYENHLRIVLDRLHKFHLTLNLDKCKFGVTEFTFLGYTINYEGIKPTREKVESGINFPKPETIDDLRPFLGMVNFYRKCIPNAAVTQAPLNVYLKDARKRDKRPIIWTPEAEAAFEQCKEKLANAVVLANPSLTPQKYD